MGNDFKNLIAWEKAMDLATTIYSVTSAFPKEERFGLTNQLRRAAVSIPSNIAEGHGRWTPGEFLRGLRIANGSRQEVQTQILLSERFQFITPEKAAVCYAGLDELGRIIFGLTKTLEK